MDIQLNVDKISQIYQDGGFLWLFGFFYHPSKSRDKDKGKVLGVLQEGAVRKGLE